jgi:hypothetical protein
MFCTCWKGLCNCQPTKLVLRQSWYSSIVLMQPISWENCVFSEKKNQGVLVCRIFSPQNASSQSWRSLRVTSWTRADVCCSLSLNFCFEVLNLTEGLWSHQRKWCA